MRYVITVIDNLIYEIATLDGSNCIKTEYITESQLTDFCKNNYTARFEYVFEETCV